MYITKVKTLIQKNKRLLILGMIIKMVISVTVFSLAQEQKGPGKVMIRSSVVCGMCKERVEKGLAFEKGVKDVSVDLETKMITIEYKQKKTDPDRLRKAISRLGYDADEIPADEKAYENLPACCKKDAPPH